MSYFMPLSVLNKLPPKYVVGQSVFILLRPAGADFFVDVGTPPKSNVVVSVARTGTATLANGHKFDARGHGLAGNRALYASNYPVCKRNPDQSLVRDSTGAPLQGWPTK